MTGELNNALNAKKGNTILRQLINALIALMDALPAYLHHQVSNARHAQALSL
jgi:hypothetical protein